MNSENKICSLANVNKRGKTTDHIWGKKCTEIIKDFRNTIICKTLILPGSVFQGQLKEARSIFKIDVNSLA